MTSTPSRTPVAKANGAAFGAGVKFEENLDADIDIASGYTTPQNRDKLAKRLHTTPEGKARTSEHLNDMIKCQMWTVTLAQDSKKTGSEYWGRVD